MARRLLALTLMLVSIAACACGEWERSYGGSGTDSLPWMIAAQDGLLAVGSTSSADGDLSMRTRTGKAGWMLRLDEEGNVLWSCVTAHAGRDAMYRPYAHADGSFSCVLSGENAGSEWLRVSDRGKVTARIEIPEAVKACTHDRAQSCYGIPTEKNGQAVLAIMITHGDGTNCCALMNEAGEITPGGSVFTLRNDSMLSECRDGSGRIAAVNAVNGDAEILWIEPGSDEPVKTFPVSVESGKLQLILSVLPCSDDSVIFSGQLYAIGSVVMRVNAQGQTLFVVDDCDNLEPMTLTSSGFAGVDADEIVFYDEDGTLLGKRPYDREAWASSLAPLGDGAAVMKSLDDGVRRSVQITAVEQYAPAQEDWYGEALYARSLSRLEYAAADANGLLLVVEDIHGSRSCLRVSARGEVLEENLPIPPMPVEKTFSLAAGQLSWSADERGAAVALRDAGGNFLWQTHTPIHTAADSVEWLCAAQAQDGRILVGGRYLSDIPANTEEQAFERERTLDGLKQEGVVIQLSAGGVLLGVTMIEDIGSIWGIAPGDTDASTLLMGTRGDMTNSLISNVVPLDQSEWGVLDLFLEPKNAYLLTMPDGSVLAAGTQMRNGRSTVVVQRMPEL